LRGLGRFVVGEQGIGQFPVAEVKRCLTVMIMIEYLAIFTKKSEERYVLAVPIPWSARDSGGSVGALYSMSVPLEPVGFGFCAGGGIRPPSAAAESAALFLGPLRD
jgi:hypothetical protein